jgi:hypothetical protein
VDIFYVYEHWRTDRDECFYVGKGKGRRAYSMIDRNRHHKAIQAKVAREGFAIEVRMVATGMSEDEAFAIECERIRFWRESNIDLANMTNGGEGSSGCKRSEQSKILQSQLMKNIPKTLEHRHKISVAHKGRPKKKCLKVKERTKEHSMNLSKSLMGRSAWNKGLKCAISEESRIKMSISAKARCERKRLLKEP